MRRRRHRWRIRQGLGCALALALAGSGCSYITTTSVASNNAPGNAASGTDLIAGGLPGPPGQPVSADGRYVAFSSDASNLVPGDTNGVRDVFVHDNRTGVTERVSVSSAEAQANGPSTAPAISADGRLVVFQSSASTLVAPDTADLDVFVRDRVAGTTSLVPAAQGSANLPVLSPDGRFVAYHSPATDDTDRVGALFLHDRIGGSTVPVAPDLFPAELVVPFFVSADNRLVGFQAGFLTDATLHLWDRITGDVETFEPDFGSGAFGTAVTSAAISADARTVAFTGFLFPPRAPFAAPDVDVFVADRTEDSVRRLFPDACSTPCVEPPGASFGRLSLSSDGRYVAFESTATNLVEPDENDGLDVFVTDLLTNTTRVRSADRFGRPADEASRLLGLSADGRYVAFSTTASNLVEGDANGVADVFTRFATPPEILSVGPSTVVPSFFVTQVVLTGTGFRPDTNVFLSGENPEDPALGLSPPTLINPTQLLVSVVTQPPAVPVPGPRNLTVLTPGTGPGGGAFGSSICVHCITIR